MTKKIELADQLGALLLAARGKRSRRELAREIGCSDIALLDLENGKANPTLERVGRMAEAYGVELFITSKPRRKS